MKKFIRDVLIWCVTYSGLSFMFRMMRKRQDPLVRVLCFHDVSDSGWFDSVLTMLRANYNVLSPEDFEERRFAEDRINVLLTFDDGYQSWVDIALPVLKKYDVKAVFFVSTGLLDAYESGEADRQGFVHERLRLRSEYQTLSWEGAKLLHENGHTIGNHTVSHLSLSQLSREEVQTEISSAKQRLMDGGCGESAHFAYPFGTESDVSFDARVSAVENGYVHVYSAISAFYDSRSKDIGRTLIERRQSQRLIRYWVEGGYDIFTKLTAFLK